MKTTLIPLAAFAFILQGVIAQSAPPPPVQKNISWGTSSVPVEVGKNYFIAFPKGFSGSDNEFPIRDSNRLRVLESGPAFWYRVDLLMGEKEYASNPPVWINLQNAISIRELQPTKK